MYETEIAAVKSTLKPEKKYRYVSVLHANAPEFSVCMQDFEHHPITRTGEIIIMGQV